MFTFWHVSFFLSFFISFFFFLKGKDKFCKKIGENTSSGQIPWPRWAAEPRNTTLTTSYRAITQNINHMTIYKKGWETPSLANEDPSQPTSLCKLKQQPIYVQLAASSLYLRLSSKINNYIRRIVLVKKRRGYYLLGVLMLTANLSFNLRSKAPFPTKGPAWLSYRVYRQ